MASAADFTIHKEGQSTGHCDCCGHATRRVWGFAEQGDTTTAVYFITWTPMHVGESGANLDVIIGRWGEGSSADDRVSVSLLHREQEDGSPSLMVVDSDFATTGENPLASKGLMREEVIGTPLATQLFAMIDAIYLQDDRLFA